MCIEHCDQCTLLYVYRNVYIHTRTCISVINNRTEFSARAQRPCCTTKLNKKYSNKQENMTKSYGKPIGVWTSHYPNDISTNQSPNVSLS